MLRVYIQIFKKLCHFPNIIYYIFLFTRQTIYIYCNEVVKHEYCKKNLSPVPGHTAARSSTSWGFHSRCHAMVLDIFGGWPDAPPPPGGRWWLLRSRAAGSESPIPWSSPNMADGSRLRRRLLRSLSDGSHPSSTQEHGSEPSVPPDLLLLAAASGSPWRSPLLPAARSPRHRDPPQQRGLSDSVSLLPPGFRHQCNEVLRSGRRRREPENIKDFNKIK